MPSVGVENPLKGFTTFVFLPEYPASSDPENDKVKKIIESELKKYGKVNTTELLVKTEKGEATDLSVFNKGTPLTFRVKNVTSLSNAKDLPFIRSTLSLRAAVTVDKTKQDYNTYIWSRNGFLPGNTGKEVEGAVRESLSELLRTFMKNYSAVNTEAPTFYLVFP